MGSISLSLDGVVNYLKDFGPLGTIVIFVLIFLLILILLIWFIKLFKKTFPSIFNSKFSHKNCEKMQEYLDNREKLKHKSKIYQLLELKKAPFLKKFNLDEIDYIVSGNHCNDSRFLSLLSTALSTSNRSLGGIVFKQQKGIFEEKDTNIRNRLLRLIGLYFISTVLLLGFYLIVALYSNIINENNIKDFTKAIFFIEYIVLISYSLLFFYVWNLYDNSKLAIKKIKENQLWKKIFEEDKTSEDDIEKSS